MGEQSIPATPQMWALVGASVLVFISGLTLLILRRKKTGEFSWAGFVLTMFLAVLLYDLGLWRLTGRFESLLRSVFYSLQTMSANRDFDPPTVTGAGEGYSTLVALYGDILFIVAPVSIVSAALEYFSGTVSNAVLRCRSLFSDSFVFSQLDARSLAMAQNIVASYTSGKARLCLMRPCVAFADGEGADKDLVSGARRMGAFCQSGDVGSVMRRCSSRMRCSVLLVGEDGEASIALARQLKDEARRGPFSKGGETRIFVSTSFRDAEYLLFPEALEEEEALEREGGAQGRKVVIRGIDFTRELVERVIVRYPVFMTTKPTPGVNMPEGKGPDSPGLLPDSCWYEVSEPEVRRYRQREFYQREGRHVLILGAGSVGTEFLSYALWASRIDGIHTRIDVVDCEEDPLHPGRTLAESRYAAIAPEIMRHPGSRDASEGIDEEAYDLTFHLVDAETEHYDRFLVSEAWDASYVFVSLGDDMLNARVAMHTRQMLERALAERSQSRLEYMRAPRPLILAVVRDDEFASTVESAKCEGKPYDIVCAGTVGDNVTCETLDALVGNRATEYKRRSTRANEVHAKYRLFAFARSFLLDRHHVRSAIGDASPDGVASILRGEMKLTLTDEILDNLREAVGKTLADDEVLDLLGQVDWTLDVKKRETISSQVWDWTVALLFQAYCSDSITSALGKGGPRQASRDWLLRMEHDRWNAYIRTCGIVYASADAERNIFATGQSDKEKHRDSFSRLHPFLVPFDSLAGLEPGVYEQYKAYFTALDDYERDRGEKEDRNKKPNDGPWARLLDDNYIGISSISRGKK